MLLFPIFIILLCFVSLIPPFAFFLLPLFKITKVNIREKKEVLLVNIVVIFLLYFLDISLLIAYVCFYSVIELLYYLFDEFLRFVKSFDRIIIMSIILSIILYFLLRKYIHILGNESTINEVVNFYKNNLKVPDDKILLYTQEFKRIISFIQNSPLIFSLIFQLVMPNIIFLYMSIKNNTYPHWKISYYWILLYIIPALTIEFLKIDNHILLNLRHIGFTIFIWYGIKTLYLSIDKQINSNILKHLLSIILGISYPFVIFILGVVASFGYLDKYIGGKKWLR